MFEYILLSIIFVVFLLIIQSMRNRRFKELLAKIPGPPETFPLVGNLDLIWSNNCDPSLNRYNETLTALSVIYADQGLFKLKLGPLQQIVIFENDLVKDILKNNENLEKPFEYQLLKGWLGKGLLINDNCALWKQRRKLLTPAFHFKIIHQFLPIINEKANILVQNLRKFVKEDSFDLAPLLFACSLDVIAETTLGFQLNSQQNENLDYIEAVHRMHGTYYYRLLNPWLVVDFVFNLTEKGRQQKSDLKIMHGLAQKIINERKQSLITERQNTGLEIVDKNKKRLAFLDLLLDLHLKDDTFTLEDIREEVDTFMFAGHDTSACCLIWTFYLLGLHPDIQQRLQDEFDSIIGNKEEITMDDIKELTYLDAVLKESLRLYPPVPLIVRKITEDLKLGEYIIPKGVNLGLYITRLHVDPKVFPEPLLFRPERFLSENQTNSENSFCFTPFSAGSRNCIGQKFALNELKVIIAKVLINFSLESLEDRNDIIVLNSIVSKPANGVSIKITSR